MMYSYRIEQAIQAASILHKDMASKGRRGFPYVSHLFSVACIVADYSAEENTIIASLLHDSVVYTDYTFADLNQDFGAEVCALVKEITESISEEDTPEHWKEKHARYIAHLKHASDEALIIVAADHIHRMRSIVEEYYNDLDRFRNDFGNVQGEHLTTQGISNILNSRRKNAIVYEFNHVFDQYKHFIYVEKEKDF